MGLRKALPAGLFLALAAAPAWAVREWYDLYLDARDRLIPAGKCTEALAELKDAEKLKPASALNEQTYGLQFVDYIPHYWAGACRMKLGEYSVAITEFNEEEKGPIRRNDALYADLKKLRAQARDLDNERIARLAREEVDRLIREGGELYRGKKLDEALARLAQAQVGAAGLDQDRQRQVKELADKIRSERKEAQEAEAREKRIADTVAEGHRLLEDGRPTEAIVRFDEVLSLDPRNAKALEGKKDAEQRILASTTRQGRLASFQEGKDLFEAAKYEEALAPLTDAAADPGNPEARILLEKAHGFVERLRTQKDIRRRIDALIAKGDGYFRTRRYPDAQVVYMEILQLDPSDERAKQRLTLAERLTGSLWLITLQPNEPPVLDVFEPRATEVAGPTVAVIGVATDDHGVALVEFEDGGKVVERVAPTVLDTGEQRKSVPFEKTLPLVPGPNEIVVSATDNQGLRTTSRLRVTRVLRWYEHSAFLPSALLSALVLVGAGLGVQQLRRRQAVRRRFNPYIAGAPVLEEGMFFGREKLMARILNVLHHNSLMITGERRIGKTTFLYHLGRALDHDSGTEYRFFPVLTDLQGVPEAGFFHAVMSDVVETLALGPTALAEMRFSQDNSGGYEGRDFSHDLQRVIAELKNRTHKKVKLALLIDEVDVLNEYSERINQRLRSIFMKTFSEHLVAIMSGVGIKRTWKSEGSPWYNFFDEVELTPFTREEAEALIKTPVTGIFRFEPDAVDAIVHYSGARPYVIQKFCVHAVNRILELRRTVVRLEDIEAVRLSAEEAEEALSGRLPTRASA